MVFIKSQAGFSLVQGMILAGILAGSSLVATRLLTDQKLAQKNAETRDQVEQLHRLVYATLQNKDHCTATVFTGSVNNLSFRSPILAVVTANTATKLTGSGANPTDWEEQVAVVGQTYINGNVSLESISIGPHANGAAYRTLSVAYQRLNNDVSRRTKSGYGSKDILKRVTLRIQRDPMQASKPFVSCYAVTEDEAGTEELGNQNLAREMCAQLNASGVASFDASGNQISSSLFEWDEATSTCKPKESVCKNPGEVYTGINSNGEVECRRIDEWMDTSLIIDQGSFDPSSCNDGDQARLQISGGKVRLICN